MKKKKLFGVLGFLMIFAILVTACAKKENSKSYKMDIDMNSAKPVASEFTGSGEDALYDNNIDGQGINSTSAVGTGADSIQSQDKIIRKLYMDIETKEFDSLVNKIGSEISRLNGYVETSQVSGKRYFNENQLRYANIVARVPSDRVDEFVTVVDEEANVVDRKEDTENVSLEYIDIESRVEALEIEQDRLFEILGKEVSLENIITLENRLSDIRYELQSYKSQLRYFDNMVAYSTITLSIQEVERMSLVTEEKQGVGDRIKNGFGNTIYHISEGFKNFFVWFVVNLPYLIIWAVIITIAILIIRKIRKKMMEKGAQKPVFMPGQQNPMYYNQQSQNQSGQSQENQKQP